jgi:hypothetical protein
MSELSKILWYQEISHRDKHREQHHDHDGQMLGLFGDPRQHGFRATDYFKQLH